ncbi:MAG: protein BatD [Deltaproteobacteria bacterium]|nr:protein BatD [Deltaproteobacteria bacterium]
MRRCILLLVFLMLLSVPSIARAGVSVVLSLDREEATLSDPVRMEIKVSGTRSCDSPPVVKGLDSFQVSPGGSSSRVEIVNGAITSGVDFIYHIQPSETGSFVIGPARVEVDGKVLESNTLTLKVVKSRSEGSRKGASIFLVAGLSSEKAYVEEQVVYTLKLFLKPRVSDISLQLPEQDHLVFRQLADPKEYQGVYHGTRYRVIEVPYGLMALKPGDYTISPSRMGMTVYDGGRVRRGFFDDPFFRMGRPVTIVSEPLELKVIPLPEKGKPEGFSGLVGAFTIEASLRPAKIRVGESATLTVQIRGRGNVNRIPDLKIPDLEHVKIYADEPVLESGKDSRGLIALKTMKWALVPQVQGDYEIPSLALSFFDPRARRYRTVRTRALPLAVIPGKGEMIMVEAETGRQGGADRPGKQGVEVLGHDILPLHTSVRDLWAGTPVLSRGPILALILLLPPLFYLSTFLGLRLKRRSVRVLPAQRAKRAAANLIRHCRRGEEDPDGLILAIRDYFNDRFGLALASITPDEAARILLSEGVDGDLANRLRQVLTGLENRIYTGQTMGTGGLTRDLPGIIKEIERGIR